MHRLESIINAFNRLETILILQKPKLLTIAEVVHTDLIWPARLYITYLIKQQAINFGLSGQHDPVNYGQGYWLFQI